MAWAFYENTFVNHSVVELLDDNASLTYFSISVNGGKKRGNKALQYALASLGYSLTNDGIIGRHTMRALETVANHGEVFRLNNLMVEYMRAFYDGLIARKPHKYARYARGWSSRMDGLMVV